jgi:hypothetical protein
MPRDPVDARLRPRHARLRAAPPDSQPWRRRRRSCPIVFDRLSLITADQQSGTLVGSLIADPTIPRCGRS